MQWPVVVAGANVVLALVLTLLAALAWSRGRDRRAGWMTSALAALLVLSGVVLWRAWTAPFGPSWSIVAAAEGVALVSLYIGALR